jgi:peptidoglycan/xylan/chitin deacetylase (PgdA/CDA1 family)
VFVPIEIKSGASRWLMMAALTWLAGCGFNWPAPLPAKSSCPNQALGQTYLVLTFDDGPFPADRQFTSDERSEDVLAPLNEILAVLDRHEARAVFFAAVHVAEPVDNDVVAQRADIFAQGLEAIHKSRHVLGYHAFNHDPSIWANPLLIPPVAEVQMNADLDRLQQFIDDSLSRVGLSQGALFAPVFRQPFGGFSFVTDEGVRTAQQRGWAYRGFHIDSGDETANFHFDSTALDRLSATTPDARHAFVRGRLRDGVAANQTQGVIDVLFHVNSFTAAHLDEWIGLLLGELGQQGRGNIVLSAPDCYATQSDTYIDPAIVLEVIAPPAGAAQ